MLPLKDDNPSGIVPFVTIGLIAANVAVFVYMSLMEAGELRRFVFENALIPYRFVGGEVVPPGGPAPLLSSMFMHGGLLHLGGNMLFLWIFGDNVEDVLGHVRFLMFYLAWGVAAAMSHVLGGPASTMPMLGASGAVAGVLGAYMVTFPRARVLTLIFVFFLWVPAVVVIGAWITVQILGGMGAQEPGAAGIAWSAHVGGFFAGAASMLIAGGRRRQGARYRR